MYVTSLPPRIHVPIPTLAIASQRRCLQFAGAACSICGNRPTQEIDSNYEKEGQWEWGQIFERIRSNVQRSSPCKSAAILYIDFFGEKKIDVFLFLVSPWSFIQHTTSKLREKKKTFLDETLLVIAQTLFLQFEKTFPFVSYCHHPS